MTPWTVARQAPVSMEFSRQEDWSGLPCPPPGDLPDPGIKPRSSSLQADPSPSEPPGKPERAGHDGKQDVKGDLKKKEEENRLLNNWVDRSTRWKVERMQFVGREHSVPRIVGQMVRNPLSWL